MAGNPFRRSQAGPPSLPLPSSSSSLADVATREAAPQPELRLDTTSHQVTAPGGKAKVQKKVRILSPVASPVSPAYREYDPFDAQLNLSGHPRPPAPEQDDLSVARQLRRSFIDSVAQGASSRSIMQPQQQQQQQQQQQPSQAYPVLLPEPPARPAPGQQAPYNPFSKTLATIESQHSPVGLSREAPVPDQAPSKATMDVDAFTRMLLTGSSAHAAASDAHSAHHHPESLPGSDDEDHGSHDDEQSGLVAEPHTRSKKAKPPPPAHHHGRLFPRKGPQTVSFADFDAAAPVSPVLPPPSPRPVLSRSSSDLNKPLPPPPPPQVPSPELTPTIDEDPAQPGDGAVQAKKPPPPPLSRRRSQQRNRPRSSSNLSRSSIAEDVADEPSPASSMKPPPPPIRRVPQSASSGEAPTEAENHVSGTRAPPPPPARHTTKGGPSLTRTLSSQSTASLSHQHQHHRGSPSLAHAPPPPPPRRSEAKRQSMDGTLLGPSANGSRRTSDASHRSSLEMRRFSGASFQSGERRTPSVSSVSAVAEAPDRIEVPPLATPVSDAGSSLTPAADGKDILADMSAFQREIDEMVAKASSKKPGTG